MSGRPYRHTFGRIFGRRRHIHRLEVCLGRRPGSWEALSSSAGCSFRRHHRAGVQIHRVLGLRRPGAWCRPSSWRSWPRGRSWKPSPGSRASCPCACRSRRARSSAVGVSIPTLLGQALQHPQPVTLRPCPSARCCAAPRWPPWSRHPPRRSPFTRPASAIAPGPSQITAVWTSWGSARAGP